jgi:hypothetical protein
MTVRVGRSIEGQAELVYQRLGHAEKGRAAVDECRNLDEANLIGR